MGDDIDGYIEDQQQRRLPVTPVKDVQIQRENGAQFQRKHRSFNSEGVTIA